MKKKDLIKLNNQLAKMQEEKFCKTLDLEVNHGQQFSEAGMRDVVNTIYKEASKLADLAHACLV